MNISKFYKNLLIVYTFLTQLFLSPFMPSGWVQVEVYGSFYMYAIYIYESAYKYLWIY